jgi:uncharacterized SAM-binding protein YcdF (DUF218 family)
MVRVFRPAKWVLLLLVALVAWVTIVGTQLYHHAQQPMDAILVLGGSIRREMVVAEAAAQGIDLPILISHGSQPPCIRILFERVAAPLDNVWLESCAESTFDNYRYSLPTLKQWGSRHVQVVTSPTHLPRAHWLAMILLGSHGIWVTMSPVTEQGVPANVEHPLKTMLDVMRSLAWALVSQVYRPRCPSLEPLSAVDLAAWEQTGFHCEHQAGIDSPGSTGD